MGFMNQTFLCETNDKHLRRILKAPIESNVKNISMKFLEIKTFTIEGSTNELYIHILYSRGSHFFASQTLTFRTNYNWTAT